VKYKAKLNGKKSYGLEYSCSIEMYKILIYGLFIYLHSSNIFIKQQHQLLEKSQENLSLVIDNAQDAKDLSGMLIKIAENCTANLTVQQYAFTRIEEVKNCFLNCQSPSKA
jgi:hypothetical protein